ncbi:unnamed protein product [Polarella glacialis]|uniref:Uncharacterized protein n=1 Tax=Polarella glacialis TaxID=89957 RepID=A0A813L449_POLGL|nr:unnamed protein product [Polarella glacialis]CAE8743756.1 unnamed protein product [Polarella glacialis]
MHFHSKLSQASKSIILLCVFVFAGFLSCQQSALNLPSPRTVTHTVRQTTDVNWIVVVAVVVAIVVFVVIAVGETLVLQMLNWNKQRMLSSFWPRKKRERLPQLCSAGCIHAARAHAAAASPLRQFGCCCCCCCRRRRCCAVAQES